jgi:hypothetical protein
MNRPPDQGNVQVEDLGRPDAPTRAARQAQNLHAGGDILMTITVRDVEEQREVEALLGVVLATVRDHKDRARDVLDAILPPATLLGEGAAAQSRRNAVLRDTIAREHGLLGAVDIAIGAGSRARNAAATATRWKTAGKIFSVPVGTTNLYPGFQFSADGAPRPEIAEVLTELAGHLAGWELAAWFTQPLDELNQMTPLAALNDLPAVLDAARYAVASLSD